MIATKYAFQKAFQDAGPVILEPFMNVEVTCAAAEYVKFLWMKNYKLIIYNKAIRHGRYLKEKRSHHEHGIESRYFYPQRRLPSLPDVRFRNRTQRLNFWTGKKYLKNLTFHLAFNKRIF